VKKGIAFFDFDGTITSKDTLLAFIRYSKGTQGLLWGFLRNSLHLIAYKLNLASNQTAKEKVLRYFFKNMPVEEFNSLCQRFSTRCLPGLIRKQALEEIKKLQQEGTIIVVVSASPENWISAWTDAMGVQLIASRLEEKEGKITGNILGRNCYGEEKVRRILEKHQVQDYEIVYAYGDTRGDQPMLKLATRAFYKPFR
jgi:HAD superfamily hydrolase (TIGR01490 family)